MKSFSNHFLVSMPTMHDPIFSKSLIYICQNDTNGSMGIIINKPIISNEVTEIIKQTGFNDLHPTPNVYYGGPLNINMGIFLHDTSYSIEGTLPISKSISLTSNKQIVHDIKNGSGPLDYHFSFGYAGWDKGQLESEIENGDWLIMPSDYKFIFSISNSKKWEQATSQFGINISDLSGSAGMA